MWRLFRGRLRGGARAERRNFKVQSSKMKWSTRWNGSRCEPSRREPSRRAERRAGFVRQGPVLTRAARSARAEWSQRDHSHHQMGTPSHCPDAHPAHSQPGTRNPEPGTEFMGAKAEIGWTRRNEDGERWDVYARHVGRDWK